MDEKLLKEIRNIVDLYGYHCYHDDEGCDLVFDMIVECLNKYTICSKVETHGT